MWNALNALCNLHVREEQLALSESWTFIAT